MFIKLLPKPVKQCVLFIACVIYANLLYATDAPIKYLGIEQGLTNNAVTCITQDRYGFMWMGTYDGLNRYDGDQFKTFRNIWGNGKSLVNNHIKALHAANNKIFVGTQKGLVYFDYADAGFHPLYLLSKNKAARITASINQIISDNSVNIYVAAEGLGLIVFNSTDTVGRQVLPALKQGAYTVQSMVKDKANKIWLYANGIGLCQYNGSTQKLVKVSNEPSSSNCLLSDAENNIWIGSDNGLFIYQQALGKISRFDNASHKLSSTNIFNLTLAKNGEVWIATNGAGVNIWNSRTQKIKYLLPGETKNTLRSGAVTAVYEDVEQRKWIATLRGGVNVIDSRNLPFHLITHDAFNKNSLVNNFIISFCEDEQRNIWIGTDGGGISYWNTKANTFTNYVHEPNAGFLSSNFAVSILNDYNNQVWVATFGGGIDAFNKSTQRFKHYSCYKLGSATEETHFWKLYEDAQHRLWATSTWGGALYLYNREADKFELFDKTLTSVHELYQDHTGQLWGGNYTKLIKLDIVHKRHRYIMLGQAVRAIKEDARHNLWIGTEGGGLIQYNPKTNSQKRYTQINGLPSNSILNILIDNDGNVWCTTYNGLSEFQVKAGKFANYYASDGLQSNQFNYNAALKLSSGKMLVGGINGFNIFSPDSIKPNLHEPQLQFTDLKINNQSIEQTKAYSQKQPLYALKQITIPFNEATIGINYTALEYSFPEKIRYAYFLEGWDHGWNDVGNIKSAYYTRLNEGEYTLKIKSTNTAGNWSSKILTISIVVLPPWYRTWWAYFIYGISIISAAVAFGIYRKRQIQLKYEVEFANLKMEKEKEANEKKLSFFTNVSHEFRTPLTLIINPIKDLLNQNTSNADELNIIYRNAKRLLGLVDHLLLFRKTESENTELKVVKFNFYELCKDVFMCFTHQAKIKHISYTLNSKSESIDVYVDREKIEIALFNLISNAIKFTPDGGSIMLSVKEDNTSVYFEITDSGVGITADAGEKLFDKYYQVKASNSLKTGFGIGLYLVKTFIESHKGTITYTSANNRGTTFTLCLPKGRQHLSNAIILETIDVHPSLLTEVLIDHDNVENTVVEPVTNNLELLISDHQSILIIDDNKEIRTYIKKIFAADYTVLEAGSGEVGLDLIRKHLPDVIICDIVMQGLSGLELCHIVKEDSATSHIPIILLTGESAPSIRLKGIEEGAVDFISKPFDKELLIARVKGIIKNKSELQNYFYKEVTLKGSSKNVSEEHKNFLYKCIQIIENAIGDPNFDVGTIADQMGMSYSSLYKKVKTITGQSINGFIRFVRLRKAAELMINTACNVNEAAFRVGYNDIKYFREHFNKQFGVNPSEFIKRHRVAFQKAYNFRMVKEV